VSAPRLLLLVLALALLVPAGLALVAPAARAEEPAPQTAPAAPEDGGGVTAKELETWIEESPAALWALVLLKYGAAAVGLVLLVIAYRRWDRIRAGVQQRGECIEPTVPFSLPGALALIGGAFLAVVGAAGLLSGAHLSGSTKLVVGMAVLQGILLLVAAVVLVRRRRLGAGPARGVGDVARRSLATFCIATTFVVPVAWLTFMLLQWLGQPITLYGPVQEVIKGEDPSTPWLIAVFSVLLAPIAEESLFRGLLYPALRDQIKGRWRVVLAAVISAALFALIHNHLPSFLPLFTLALVLAWAFERTNSLAVVIGAHAMWNLATLVPLLLRAST